MLSSDTDKISKIISGKSSSDKAINFQGICTDTRGQISGKLFIALEGENFDAFIVLKQTKKGAKPVWVKVGKTDLNFVEVKQGIDPNEVVFVLPSEGLIKYQQRFSERIKSRFG